LIWGLEDAAQGFEDVSNALKTVQGTIDAIMGDTNSVQSEAYMTQKYDDLLIAAQTDPAKAQEFAGFAQQYLGFMEDYGDPKIREGVLQDLFSVESILEDQMSTEQIMADRLQGIWENTGNIDNLLTSYFRMTDQPWNGEITPFDPSRHTLEMVSPQSPLPVQAQAPIENNVQIRVFVGNKELKDITIETIRTDPQAQKTIKRVAHV
jgi:hypothetical protein